MTRAQKRTLSVVWITYGAFYLCRVNIGPARTEIQKSLAIDALEMGLVLGALKIGYALGQLVNGQLTERFGPRKILLMGMLGSATACLLFTFAANVGGLLGGALPVLAAPIQAAVRVVSPGSKLGPLAALLLFLWFVNGYFQAGGWPPCVKIMSRWFSTTERGRIMGVIGTSYQLGSALTILGAGALVSAFHDDWRAAFLPSALLLLVAAGHAALRVKERPGPDEAPSVPEETRDARDEHAPLLETLRLTLGNGRIWLLAFCLFGLNIVRYGFLDWAPGHLKEVHGSGVLLASLKVAVFPLAGGLGALVSGYATDRWFQSRRAPVIAITLGMVGLLTFAYGRVVTLGVLPTVLCLAGIGFFLYGAQILVVGTAAQDFAKKRRAAAAAGFVDFMGYFGAFGGDVITGYLLKHRDFHAAIGFWTAAAAVSALIAASLWRTRPVAPG